MNRFEQLIEYVINDEEAKAKELFHEICVETSRKIYEDIMAAEAKEEDLDEAKEEDDLDEAKEEDLDEAKEEDLDEEAEEDLDETVTMDAADSLVDEVEADEEMAEGDEEEIEGGEEEMGTDSDADMEMDSEGGSDEPATKDDIMNIEDKLDQIMAEFEAIMGSDDMGSDDMGGDDMGGDDVEGADALEVDDTEELAMEAVNLKAAPKPVTSEESGVNKQSIVSANAGAKGPVGNTVKPVKTGADSPEGKHDSAAYKNQAKDLIGKVGNTPAQGTQSPKPANKPKLSQETGVNNKSPVAGR